ncbi:hypothetical protein AB0D59_46565 [Streptomyces sp. NPDC048417]|uniref:hypothetical protein n=1 Tax=Streptomyces sp. NPDC048417 TaxID=3155387 RepID=UPI0034337E89
MPPVTTCPKCGAQLGPSRVRGEGPWCQGWRSGLSSDQQYVSRGDMEGDVLTPCGHIVELQYGPLSRVNIELRERVYGTMVWLFHACSAHRSGRLRLGLSPGRPHVNFAWRQPRETLDACRRTVHLDLGESDQADGLHLVLRINRWHPKQPGRLSGSGILYTAEAFHNWMAHGLPLTPFTPEAPDHAAA